MTNPISALSKQDKENITTWIETWGPTDTDKSYNVLEPIHPIEDILTYWNRAKKDLFHLFNDKLIISKKIEYLKPVSELRLDMYKQVTKGTPIRKALYAHLPDDSSDITYVTEMLFEENLIRNSVPTTHTYTLVPEEGNPIQYTVKKGTKVTRAIRNMATKMGIDEDIINDFLTAQSKVMNEARFTGTLCLSIHPLDYMTMSDSACKWRSCMSWDDGEYRVGTVEMMNSYHVVVAYLQSESNTLTVNDTDFSWPGKKWRELFIVNDDLIMGVKGYPYQSSELEKIVIDTLADLRPEHYEPGIVEIWPWDEEHPYPWGYTTFEFETNAMYNDVYANNRAYPARVVKGFSCGHYEFNYSGRATCVYCGRPLKDPEDNISILVCSECSHEMPIGKCHCCGRLVYNYNYGCETSEGYIFCDAGDCWPRFATNNFAFTYDPEYDSIEYNPSTILLENSAKVYLARKDNRPDVKNDLAAVMSIHTNDFSNMNGLAPKMTTGGILYYNISEFTSWNQLVPWGAAGTYFHNPEWKTNKQEKVTVDNWRRCYLDSSSPSEGIGFSQYLVCDYQIIW